MQSTKTRVNAALKRAGINGEIVRGDGYWYFTGPDFERSYETGVYGCSCLSHMSVEQWISEAKSRLSVKD